MPSLTRAEAAARAETIRVQSYRIDLDLTTGAETFRSTVTIRFTGQPGAGTFVELKPVRLLSAQLNGEPIDPGALSENRLPLADLDRHNELVIDAQMAYSNTGEGLHRFVDPADGETYLYAMTFLDEAQRVFACFDQPDLKAPVTLAVTADPEWTVVGNAPEAARPAPGRWEFAETMPLATYFVTLLTGPYHAVRSEHDGIPLTLYCRASLAPNLDADAAELLSLTADCFDKYHELFGFRYPFGKYDQAFVPEFNAGAMENPGCVTFRDDYVFRSAVTDAERERRATTVAHEMAHMWFGDVVTMRWWDDLWLNESFADYLGTRVVAQCGYPSAWTTFAIREKAWGYAADQRPSTHPVAADDVPDAARALLNFDGISYAKGAAALRQLVAWVGEEEFLAGLRAHIASNAYGNATLADLLANLSAASGRDLDGWAEAWLRTSNVDTLRPVLAVGPDGRYETVEVEHTSPTVLRPHRIAIGLYDWGLRRTRVELDVAGARTPVPVLAGAEVADLLLLNDSDLSYAKVRLDPATWDRLPVLLPAVDDDVTRALLWLAVGEAVRDSQRPARDLIDLACAVLPHETEVGIIEQVLQRARDIADRFLVPADRADALAGIADACARLLSGRGMDASRRLAAARGYLRSTVDIDVLRGWLDGKKVPPGLVVDAELRWRIVYRLAVLDAAGKALIDETLAADRTAPGEEWAARCGAALPTEEGKARAWRIVVDDPSASNRMANATAEGFWQPEQAALTASFVDRYFAEISHVARYRSGMVLERLAATAFPQYAVEERTRGLARNLLARPDVDPAVRRSVVDADDDLGRALAARARVG